MEPQIDPAFEMNQISNPLEPGSITSDENKKESEKLIEFRRALNMLEEERTKIRNLQTTFAKFEDVLMKNDMLRTFVIKGCIAQAEVLEKTVNILGKIETKLRDEIPVSKAPALHLADKEEWHIKMGFSYAHPDGSGRTIRYGAGEPLPPNMTQEDCNTLYAKGHIYKFVRGDGGKGVYVPHPKVVQLNRAQMLKMIEAGAQFMDHFMQRNVVKMDTLLRLKVTIAEHKESNKGLDPRIMEIVDREIGKYELEATGRISPPGQ